MRHRYNKQAGHRQEDQDRGEEQAQTGGVGTDRRNDTDRRNRHTDRRRGTRTKAIFFKVTDMRLYQLEMRQSRKVF